MVGAQEMDAAACVVRRMTLALPTKSATFATMTTMSGAAKKAMSARRRLNQQTRSPNAGRYGPDASPEESVPTAAATSAVVITQTYSR